MESTESTIGVCHFFPIIYQVGITQKCLEDILNLFVEEILQGCNSREAESCIISYITRVIEPVGWKAVWRATQESLGIEAECDFIVEVVNVSRMKLEADVLVKSILSSDAQDFDLMSVQDKFKMSNFCTVPLIELNPISEGDEYEMFAKTAIAIGYVRLFYKHLCRPWDSEDDDIVYSEKQLRPRLQLYFDMKNKVVPEIMISKIKLTLKEAWNIINSLKSLYSSMNLSDSEPEVMEDDVIETIELRKKLQELQRRMEMLENPVIRTILMKKYSPRKSPQKEPSELGPLSYLIAAQFTYQMVTDLKLALSTPLKFDHCPEHALKSCSDGDTYYLFPGYYRCDTLGWIDTDITVKGVGPSGSIRIQATGNSEVFLNCDSSFIKLENITLISSPGTVSTIVIHHGSVNMKDCLIDSDCAEVGVILLAGSELTMIDSEVCNAKEDGIQLRPSSSLTMKNCKVVSCGQHGIQIDADEDPTAHTPSTTELFITDSFIVSNDGHGIYVNSTPGIQAEEAGGITTTLDLFPWLKYKVENTVMSHNKHLGIGTAPSHKLVKSLTQETFSSAAESGDAMLYFGSPELS